MAFHDFRIRFTLSARADASALLHHLHAHAKNARSHVRDARELDLEFGFGRCCVLLKNLENQIDAIPHNHVVWS